MTAIRQIVALRFWPDDVGAVRSGRGSSPSVRVNAAVPILGSRIATDIYDTYTQAYDNPGADTIQR
jgi:hypothetical protein